MGIWFKNKQSNPEVSRRLPAQFHTSALGLLKMSPAFRDIFFNKGSMTSLLKKLGDGKVSVKLLEQRWQRPQTSEIKGLAANDDWGIGREVILSCFDQPWMFARTFISEQVVQSQGTRFSALGARPIGELLFNNPLCHRGEFSVACLWPGHREFYFGTQYLDKVPEYLWARRSQFTLPGGTIALLEIFLPAMEQAIQNGEKSNAF